ncbi:hypothetical protein BDV97DRAFT_345430 [Delphinella strobiligena]|nr:hypothetical protein BDV97DRAFT_345430 [Delphinella strobiligena]
MLLIWIVIVHCTVRTHAHVSVCLLSPRARSLLQTPFRCGRSLDVLAAELSIRNDQCCNQLSVSQQLFIPYRYRQGNRRRPPPNVRRMMECLQLGVRSVSTVA